VSIPTQTQALQLALDTAAQQLVFVKLASANPTQANIDAMVNSASRANIVITPPKAGDKKGWQDYEKQLIDTMAVLRQQLQRSSGPIFAPMVFIP
jgi:hypothetical protein